MVQSAPVANASRALRAILMRSFILVALIATLVLAVPLGWAVATTYRAEAEAALDAEATRVLALTSGVEQQQLPTTLDPAVTVGLYNQSGALTAGSGPATDDDARGAVGDGVTRIKTENGELAAYVPLTTEEGQRISIRATSPLSAIRNRTYRAWALLASLVALSVGVSAFVAHRRARLLALPFERLALAAQDFHDGGFALQISPTGVAEGDEVARALEAAASSAADRVEVARALAQDTSHQVRTPIAAARLTLESALTVPDSDLPAAAEQAIRHLDRATTALAEVLELRSGREGTLTKGPALRVIHESHTRWTGVASASGRSLDLVIQGDLSHCHVAETVLRQVLDVLLDNALKHGKGSILMTGREV